MSLSSVFDFCVIMTNLFQWIFEAAEALLLEKEESLHLF